MALAWPRTLLNSLHSPWHVSSIALLRMPSGVNGSKFALNSRIDIFLLYGCIHVLLILCFAIFIPLPSSMYYYTTAIQDEGWLGLYPGSYGVCGTTWRGFKHWGRLSIMKHSYNEILLNFCICFALEAIPHSQQSVSKAGSARELFINK